MYELFYGLKEKPFSLTPDPEFVYMGKAFREALDRVLSGIKRREGFTVVVGDVGTGKTTLCWTLLGRLEPAVRTALILNPLLNEVEILRAILKDFGVRPRKHIQTLPALQAAAEPGAYDSKWMKGLTQQELIDELNQFLLEGTSEDITNLLVIDEAQNLSIGVLELLRILSNLETPKRKLLQIMLVGQLGFEQKLRLPQLRPLNQRITVRCHLRPLGKDDVVRYIHHRLLVAGGSRNLSFTGSALRGVYKFSRGYPRLINALCDRLLLAGYRERPKTITGKMIRKAAQELVGRNRSALHVRLVGSVRWILPVPAVTMVIVIALALLWNSSGWRSKFFGPLNSSGVNPPSVLASEKVPGPPGFRIADPIVREGLPREEGPSMRGEARAEAPASPPVPTRSGLSGSYLLQVHSLETKKSATDAVRMLQKRGYPALERPVQNADKSQRYRVYVGPFDSRERAMETAHLLKTKEGLVPILRGPDSSQD